MNKDQIKGKVENLKGRVKEAVGSLTGNKETQAEGTIERIKGATREKIGEAKGEIARDVEKDEDEDED